MRSQIFVFHGDRWIGGILFHIPGDSSRDFLIPQLEVTNNLWKGHLAHKELPGYVLQ